MATASQAAELVDSKAAIEKPDVNEKIIIEEYLKLSLLPIA